MLALCTARNGKDPATLITIIQDRTNIMPLTLHGLP